MLNVCVVTRQFLYGKTRNHARVNVENHTKLVLSLQKKFQHRLEFTQDRFRTQELKEFIFQSCLGLGTPVLVRQRRPMDQAAK
jgi:hypothetical protein